MYGHKRVYLYGWLWFSVWSLTTGFAYSSNSIVFSTLRALQGIGGHFYPHIIPHANFTQVPLYSYQTPSHSLAALCPWANNG